MKELKNYIFIDITGIALKHFKRSKFLTFSSYCINYGLSIQDGQTPSGDRFMLTELYDYLKDVYCFSNEEVGDYLLEYFSLPAETLSNLMKCETSMRYYHPYSFR